MTIRIQTTNSPVDDNGKGTIIEVGDEEFADLSRMGLVVNGKGDVQDDGTLRPKVAKEASAAAVAATGQQPTIPGGN